MIIMGAILRRLAPHDAVVQSACSVLSGTLHGLQREAHFWNQYPLPLRHRLRGYRHGFLSRAYRFCRLDENDPGDYLSDLTQYRYVRPAVNSQYMEVFCNKISFHRSTEPYVDGIPRLLGTLESDSFVPFVDGFDDIPSLVDELGTVIVKPVTGSMGRDVRRVERTDDGYAVNDTTVSRDELTEHLSKPEDAIITEFVEQHAYAERVWPHSTNTIRILTIMDPVEDEPFVACAVHRFGGDGTGPVDNWSSNGVAAPIDVESGEMIDLLSYSTERGITEHEAHPDTETPVVGRTIPDWETVREFVLGLAVLHRQNPYVGWDVVLTDDGPVVLEGNCAPGHALFQLHRGLLEDDRVARFFDRLR